MVQYRSTDRCFSLQVAAEFSVQPAPGSPAFCPGRARAQPRRVTSAVPDQLIPACKGTPMNVMARHSSGRPALMTRPASTGSAAAAGDWRPPASPGSAAAASEWWPHG